MNMTFLSTQNFGLFSTFLDLIFILCMFFGILTIISKNPIVSVIYLIMLFSSIAAYLIMLGLVFIGLSYLLVYVGAVSILFLFILMLINIRFSELISNTLNNIPLSLIVILALFIPYNNLSFHGSTNISFLEKLIYYVSSFSWDNKIVDILDITSIGNIMYTNYSIWLIITSIILLLAMVGSIIITVKQKY